MFLKPLQYLMLAQNTKVLYGDFGGTASMATGKVPQIAGFEITQIRGNRLPNTDLTSATAIPAQYRANFTYTTAIVASPLSVGCLQVRGFKTVLKEQEDRFGFLMLASQVQGLGTLRQECAIEWQSDPAGTD